jgi:hypothetical protein
VTTVVEVFASAAVRAGAKESRWSRCTDPGGARARPVVGALALSWFILSSMDSRSGIRCAARRGGVLEQYTIGEVSLSLGMALLFLTS